MYAFKNPPQTASPDKYPQGKFKNKICRKCGAVFSPLAPSHLYCSEACSQHALTSAYLMRNYDITLEHYLMMLEEQNHRCAICGGEGFTMDKKHRVKLVVEHDHVTGRVRGLLCHNCNRALGLFHDNTKHLEVAITYLEGVTTIPQGSRDKRPEAPGPLLI